MKLGAQLFSLRDECDTPEKLRNCLLKVKKMGYDCAQASAICSIEPDLFKEYIDEAGLPITLTHRSIDEICDNTDWCIDFHKKIGCDTIGLGRMPNEYRDSYDGIIAFTKKLEEPIRKIKDAGLSFAYHNHAFEFEMRDEVMVYDCLIDKLPDMGFIVDVYWTLYAGYPAENYIRQFAKSGRINHVHFKDMKTSPNGAICACGDGIIDFKKLTDVCKDSGIEYIYVEQDNAPDFGSLAEIKKSYDYLKNIVKGD